MSEHKDAESWRTKMLSRNKYPLARKVSIHDDDDKDVDDDDNSNSLIKNDNGGAGSTSAVQNITKTNPFSIINNNNNLSTYQVAQNIIKSRALNTSPVEVKNQPKFSEYVLKALQEKRSQITSAGRYQDRYVYEFGTGKQNMSTNYYMQQQKIPQEPNNDLVSYKLVKSAASAPSSPNPSNKELLMQLNDKFAEMNKLRVQKPTENNTSENALNKPSISVNLKANLVQCKTAPNELKEKPMSTTDVLSRLEAQINTLEANILKRKDAPKSNLYGEHENLLKSGISDLATNNEDDGSSFDRGTRSRNSTGGVNPVVSSNAEAKLGRHASDSQDRPNHRRPMVRNVVDKILPPKYFVKVTFFLY